MKAVVDGDSQSIMIEVFNRKLGAGEWIQRFINLGLSLYNAVRNIAVQQ